ncbi:GGDEF domain-containing protein [Azospira restricta]|uniref:diguanylate cyclase n=1 Tax=Azospira restricta TaxID=404405 RepID=A0A974SRG9_9RHOO|nr:GGDEF domain-containing protein [Azospira restricta]QRJ65054.1 diguanylate cyclase [Azospira restricta]
MLRWLLGCLLLAGAVAAQADQAAPESVIDFQLRWHHQFQFAGYYAALEKGFYREEGLEVRIHAGSPGRQPVKEVLAGRAQYAEGNSEILHQRLLGQPLVALAAIFQHSPSVLIARRDSGIASAHDLIGKRVMLMDGNADADFLTMLLNEGISPSQVNILPSSYDFNDLLSGKVDAFNSYLTNEPFYLRQQQVDFTVIDPRSYRVDFYSDVLFTSEAEVRDNPARVQAFRRATLKGWRYAMEHPAEIIDLLLAKYGVSKSREHLEFEAAAMRSLILPDLIEIGHMNPGRWQHMADAFIKAGLVKSQAALAGFVYDPRPPAAPAWVVPVLLGALLAVGAVLSVAGYFIRVNRRLLSVDAQLREANERLVANLAEISALHKQLQEQAVHDPLTGLYNRRYLDEVLERELARAVREGYPVSVAMIDLDHFKAVNDTYGHKAGDRVLQALGRLLHEQAREGDVPCRFGGEEFVLVLPRMAGDNARRRAEQWREAFAAQATRHGEIEIHCTMSVGLATYPGDATSAEGLLAGADRALYRAKAGGRNRVEAA